MKNGIIPIIAGFQGISEENRVTTLGRGGSDTTAVAIACSIHADLCDIYTDVDGVYTSDPRIIPEAQKMKHISFEEMLEMASQGAKVLQTRSVELAMSYNMPIRVRSTFIENDFENIIAVKEAGNNVAQYLKLLKIKPDNFLVLSGDDDLALGVTLAGKCLSGIVSLSLACNSFHFLYPYLYTISLGASLLLTV